MSYTAVVFVAGEQPTTSKWNLLGSNDAGFNDGSGFAWGASAVLTGGVWSSYAPAVSLAGSGPSNGNAVITGGYQQIGKTVKWWVKYIIGNTTTFTGLTAILITLPVAPSADFDVINEILLGSGAAAISGAFYRMDALSYSNTQVQLVGEATGGASNQISAVSGTFPATWVIGSVFKLSGTYGAA